ncbi:hypothetical protein E3E26_02650 [Thermococcus sp. LS1]|uniref:hypothetical protein n=1 Tax=Thermococcus sp. LS1 TaxID=1638259 RepID=UPI00143B07DB|nr:hypothetical protein [Thermococcus sp. LS1]NJD98697.1 hypothetical protein [Thermococcus sp. LS1]
MADRLSKAFLFFIAVVIIVVGLTISLSEERYRINVEVHFASPAELEGIELLEKYPNEVTHVALFRFRYSEHGRRDFHFTEDFDVSPDYVVAEIRNGDTFYCRASFEDGHFVIREEKCSPTLEGALKRRITLSACVNGTYLGHEIERGSIVYFLFEASNGTTCVNDTVEVLGRTWGIFARIVSGNVTILCNLENINGTSLTDEVVTINKEWCGPEN